MKDLLVVGVVGGSFVLGRIVQFISDARSSMGKGSKRTGTRA